MTRVFASALLMAVAACGAPATGTVTGPHTRSPEPGVAGTPLAHIDAASDIDGAVVGPAAPHTEATVVVFFASWCGPCRHELALLGELTQSHPSVRIIGVNAYEEWGKLSDEQRLRAFLAQSAPWLRVVPGADPLLAVFGGVPRIPSLFVFDREGGMVRAFRRDRRAPPTRQELVDAVEGAIGLRTSSL